ncbi:hypothetical protein BOW53_02850 [Solemya pervernicosa gill symbiont]|uniref:Uncharacterized protein n=1 Tax=Solemya pervernicosa gill symbiont TaxID=642797 RepID=A0A1T2L9C2_9GAMM|nr:hypothetical protein [Solemya pervernicosa gill symbiont]OOZ41634.1 hypothetical protein BOW53_02850 [Solemya pervernicosa gill symbiont]
MRIPKTKAAWRRLQPSNLREAFRLCKDYARQHHRRTVPAIAELIDETEDTLYKWLSNGKMPASKIPAYEHACGIDYVTQYLALRGHKLLIDIPTGKAAEMMDLNELQLVISQGMTLLMQFYQDQADPEETAEALTKILGGVAYHRANVACDEPELDLFAGAE